MVSLSAALDCRPPGSHSSRREASAGDSEGQKPAHPADWVLDLRQRHAARVLLSPAAPSLFRQNWKAEDNVYDLRSNI